MALTKKEKQSIVRMYENGKTVLEISEVMGKGSVSVKNFLGTVGLNDEYIRNKAWKEAKEAYIKNKMGGRSGLSWYNLSYEERFKWVERIYNEKKEQCKNAYTALMGTAE